MKLFLFGGAEVGQVRRELKMIETVINQIKPKQLLHVPFARLKAHEPEWRGDWFHRNIILDPSIEYLNARRPADIAKAKTPLIFISGGHNGVALIEKIKSSPRLLKLIKNAEAIVGESKGAMILCESFYTLGRKGNRKVLRGLDIIKNTVMEAHYSQKKRERQLLADMAETGVKYGIGLDSCTALEFDSAKFPKGTKKTGRGKADIKKLKVGRSPAGKR